MLCTRKDTLDSVGSEPADELKLAVRQVNANGKRSNGIIVELCGGEALGRLGKMCAVLG